jgi:hypothetical protein
MRNLALVFTAVAFCAFATPSNAPQSSIPRTGNDFLQQCSRLNDPETAPSSYEIGVCMGYVFGTLDTLVYTQGNIRSMPEISSKSANIAVPICIPADSTPAQAVRIILKWLDAHPEKLHYPIYVLAEFALHDAFPCQAAAPTKKLVAPR